MIENKINGKRVVYAPCEYQELKAYDDVRGIDVFTANKWIVYNNLNKKDKDML